MPCGWPQGVPERQRYLRRAIQGAVAEHQARMRVRADHEQDQPEAVGL